MSISDQTSSGSIPSREQTKRPAETPPPVTRLPKSGKRLNRSTFLGMLLFLQRNRELTDEQERFVIRLQAKVKLEELTAAIELLTKLSNSSRARARAKEDLELAREKCGRIPAKSITPEARRIGVGYRDKGALRPSHRPREESPEMFWSEDLSPDLSIQPEEPTWISSEELFGTNQYAQIKTKRGTIVSLNRAGLHLTPILKALLLKHEAPRTDPSE